MTSSTEERRIVTVALPDTFAGFDERLLDALNRAAEPIERFTVELESVAGRVGTDRWAAKLEHPPTHAELGALMSFMHYLEIEVDELQAFAKRLRAIWLELDALRENGHVHFEGWDPETGQYPNEQGDDA